MDQARPSIDINAPSVQSDISGVAPEQIRKAPGGGASCQDSNLREE